MYIFTPTTKTKSKQASELAFIYNHLEYVAHNTLMMNLSTSNIPLKA